MPHTDGAITIDARDLLQTTLTVSGQTFDTRQPAELLLAPGTHRFEVGPSLFSSIEFSITPTGLVDYTPSLGSPLTGRGSRCLGIHPELLTIRMSLGGTSLSLDNVSGGPTAPNVGYRVNAAWGSSTATVYFGLDEYGHFRIDPAYAMNAAGNGGAELYIIRR